MTAYSMTITNSVRIFSPEPTEKWATTGTSGTTPMIWGSDNWAYGTVGLPVVFTKGIANSVGSTSTANRTFYKGISDSFNVFGLGPTERWATTGTTGTSALIWGVDYWGYGSIALPKQIQHYYSNDLANTTAVGKNMQHYYTNSVANTTAVGKNMMHVIYEATALTEDNTPSAYYGRSFSETLGITTGLEEVYILRTGYYRTYGGIVNALSWPSGSGYSTSTASAISWSTGAVTTTTWV